jgi:hypothetical protein
VIALEESQVDLCNLMDILMRERRALAPSEVVSGDGDVVATSGTERCPGWTQARILASFERKRLASVVLNCIVNAVGVHLGLPRGMACATMVPDTPPEKFRQGTWTLETMRELWNHIRAFINCRVSPRTCV